MDFEGEYNNRRRVPESAAILTRWEEAAAAFRRHWPNQERDLPYGQAEVEQLDLFLPLAEGPWPLALFIHGGWWQSLSRHVVSHFAFGLLSQGIAVAVPSYGLCPAYRLVEIIAQMRRAALMLYRRFSCPLLAIGHSAGGHLAVALRATDWTVLAPELGQRAVVPAALPISGVFELAPVLRTSLAPALALSAEEARALSPRYWPPPAGGGVHVVVGGAESDEFRRQSRDFAASWGASWEELPGCHHFSVLAPLTDPTHPLTLRAAAMARQLASPSGFAL